MVARQAEEQSFHSNRCTTLVLSWAFYRNWYNNNNTKTGYENQNMKCTCGSTRQQKKIYISTSILFTISVIQILHLVFKRQEVAGAAKLVLFR